MRIVGGTFRGRTIRAPDSAATRPTSDRVRESIFNILAHGISEHVLDGARVMDVFAGSGALGFEALSRGAKFCQFVEEGAAARAAIRQNADDLGVIGQCKIWRRDATRLGLCAPQSPFDLVFCDPPYGKGLGTLALASLIAGDWLNKDAVVVVEESVGTQLEVHPGLSVIDQRNYGDTSITIFRHTAQH